MVYHIRLCSKFSSFMQHKGYNDLLLGFFHNSLDDEVLIAAANYWLIIQQTFSELWKKYS